VSWEPFSIAWVFPSVDCLQVEPAADPMGEGNVVAPRESVAVTRDECHEAEPMNGAASGQMPGDRSVLCAMRRSRSGHMPGRYAIAPFPCSHAL
jgi:hypothetical protein